MSKTDIQPSSIEGIKRLAKAISKRDAISHSEALDTASQVSGFGNFRHARRSLGDRSAEASLARNVVYISTFWEDGQTRTSGRETIRVFISKPLDELIKPSQYRYAHKLGRSGVMPQTMWSMSIDQTRRARLWTSLAEPRGYCSSSTSRACSHPRHTSNPERYIRPACLDVIMEVPGTILSQNITSGPTNLTQGVLRRKVPSVTPGRGNTTGRLQGRNGRGCTIRKGAVNFICMPTLRRDIRSMGSC
ncbi:hypothetical protein [Mesorhizobium sp. AR07]|uniref:hypothetical protein n=1 Tax=Mesorhizobium sp. AR07 TaxID=2865838 RepID=UPI00215E2CE2|nr:hypothetical protein [Mesorhizobium sp. AR07]